MIMDSALLDGFQRLRQRDLYPGLYRAELPWDPDPLLKTAATWGWRVGYINGKIIGDKTSFLRTFGEVLAFPDSYRLNWDAFEEMINDLSWLPGSGYLLLYDQVYRFAGAKPTEWRTAQEILQIAAANWAQCGVPMYILLGNNWWWNRNIPHIDTASPHTSTAG